MYGHQCSQAIPAFAIKPCVLATKSHMLNFCEACAAMCCICHLGEPIMQKAKRFSVLRKKRPNSDFRKVVISSSIPDGLHKILTSKYKRPRNKPNDCAYENRQNAITFTRANNSDLLRALKHVMEASLYWMIIRFMNVS